MSSVYKQKTRRFPRRGQKGVANVKPLVESCEGSGLNHEPLMIEEILSLSHLTNLKLVNLGSRDVYIEKIDFGTDLRREFIRHAQDLGLWCMVNDLYILVTKDPMFNNVELWELLGYQNPRPFPNLKDRQIVTFTVGKEELFSYQTEMADLDFILNKISLFRSEIPNQTFGFNIVSMNNLNWDGDRGTWEHYSDERDRIFLQGFE